jgi:hypothetical protein
VSATIKIVPCKPFVRLQYIPCHSKQHAMQVFTAESRKGVVRASNASNGNNGSNSDKFGSDFVEELAFSPDKYVIMLGDMVDEKDIDKTKVCFNTIFSIQSITMRYVSLLSLVCNECILCTE